MTLLDPSVAVDTDELADARACHPDFDSGRFVCVCDHAEHTTVWTDWRFAQGDRVVVVPPPPVPL